MFGTIFILYVLQKGFLALGSIWCLILWINIHSLDPHPKRSQYAELIEDLCRHEQHTSRWSHCEIIFGQLLSSNLHRDEQVLLPLSLLHRESPHNAIHVIKHVILHCDTVMQCDCMCLRHPQGPISEWPQFFHDILANRRFILCCEWWLIMAIFWISELLAGELLQLVGTLM